MDGEGVGGIQNDIIFDNTVLSLDPRDCVINPAIGLFPLGTGETTCLEDTSIGACKNLSKTVYQCTSAFVGDCPAEFGSDHSAFRAIIAATAAANTNDIPPGSMYTCRFGVIDRTALPTTLVATRTFASDAVGGVLAAAGVNGVVLSGDTSSPQSSSAAGDGGGGCTIDRNPASSLPAYLALLPIVLVRRRATAHARRRH